MASSSSSPSSRNWSYDVFPSFSGEDVRNTFLSHFLKELDRKLIIAFKDNEIKRSESLDPELTQAIKDSRIAVVIFSKNYASSSWCLKELLAITKCKKDCGQMVIPVFYGLDPSHVRKQTGDFGKIFEKTCQNQKEEDIILWRKALTDVANILGFHIVPGANEAWMIEEIANTVLDKLSLNLSDKFENYVGIEDHIKAMSSLLHLDSKEVRMVGIWGPSGIGKTTIARALFSRISHNFQGSVFIDKVFISKSMEAYGGATRVDYTLKLHLQRYFLAKFFDKNDMKIEHLGGAMENMLRHQKVLIFIDDLDDQGVLDALAGESQWFGSGSRIIVVTRDKQFLRAHGIDHIYEVCLPSEDLALKMFCRSAFRKDSPPDGFMELASEVVLLAGNLPLGLDILGSKLRGTDKEAWMDMLPSFRNGLDGKIDKTLRVSYDGLKENTNHGKIFRYIACLFNGMKVDEIKLLLADSKLGVDYGIRNLLDKSLIHVREDRVDMHSLLQKMGKEIVREQSDKPGKREFVMDSEDICNILGDNSGTEKVLGIALDLDEINELHVDENAFKGMRNLHFLEVEKRPSAYAPQIPFKLLLPESFDHLPPKLKYLRWYGYPMRRLPSNFCPENLVTLIMHNSKLEKLWEGVMSLTCLKELNLCTSKKLKEIPDLSKATNLEKLVLQGCSGLLELPSSIRNLITLRVMNLNTCGNLKTIPIGIYLNTLEWLDLSYCSELMSVPEILSNISRQRPFTPRMTWLYFYDNPSLVELPSSFQNLNNLKNLQIMNCENLETLPSGMNLQSLEHLTLSECSRLRSFPNISRNIVDLNLSKTAIEEVPWWIVNFSRLTELRMGDCNNLRHVSLNILKLKHLQTAHFPDCKALTEASWDESPSVVAMTTDNIHSRIPDEASSSLPNDYISAALFDFRRCLNFYPKALLQQETVGMGVILSGKKVPSYFTHRNTGTSLTNIPLPHISPSQQFLKFKACVLCDVESFIYSFEIQVCFRFIDISGNHFEYDDLPRKFSMIGWESGGNLVIFDCCFPLNKVITPLADQVDIQFRLIDDGYMVKLKKCGIQLPGNRPCNTNILPHVSGGNTSNKAYLGDHEAEHGCHENYQCGDSYDNDIGSEAELENSEDIYMESETDKSEDNDDRVQLTKCDAQLVDSVQPFGNRPCNPSILPHVSGGNTSNNAYLGDQEAEHSQECGGSAVESNPDTLTHVDEADVDNLVNDGCHRMSSLHAIGLCLGLIIIWGLRYSRRG